MSTRLRIESFFDEATSTYTHLLWDADTRQAAIVDSVLGFDPKSGRTSTAAADALIARVRELDLQVQWQLETHVHADHLSAAPHLKAALGGQVAIGARITTVQQTFGRLFNAGADFARDGSQFDRLFEDGDIFVIGGLQARALHTPGHTPACMTYVVEDGARTVAFVGDTLFMEDYGTARCDFPGGDAATLYHSIQRVLDLPGHTELFLCHDYPPHGRAARPSTTVVAQRRSNLHAHDGVTEAEFVTLRKARDAQLEMPVLLLPSVQVNMRAGHWPPAEDNGVHYLKIPLNRL